MSVDVASKANKVDKRDDNSIANILKSAKTLGVACAGGNKLKITLSGKRKSQAEGKNKKSKKDKKNKDKEKIEKHSKPKTAKKKKQARTKSKVGKVGKPKVDDAVKVKVEPAGTDTDTNAGGDAVDAGFLPAEEPALPASVTEDINILPPPLEPVKMATPNVQIGKMPNLGFMVKRQPPLMPGSLYDPTIPWEETDQLYAKVTAQARSMGNRSRNGRILTKFDNQGVRITTEPSSHKAKILSDEELADTAKAPNNDQRWTKAPNPKSKLKVRQLVTKKWMCTQASPEDDEMLAKLCGVPYYPTPISPSVPAYASSSSSSSAFAQSSREVQSTPSLSSLSISSPAIETTQSGKPDQSSQPQFPATSFGEPPQMLFDRVKQEPQELEEFIPPPTDFLPYTPLHTDLPDPPTPYSNFDFNSNPNLNFNSNPNFDFNANPNLNFNANPTTTNQ